MSVLYNAKVNDVFAVRYGENVPNQERVGRVLKVRDLTEQPLHPDTVRRRPDVPRTSFMVTLQFKGGEVRNMYAGLEHESKTVPLIRRALLLVKGKLPPKTKPTS